MSLTIEEQTELLMAIRECREELGPYGFLQVAICNHAVTGEAAVVFFADDDEPIFRLLKICADYTEEMYRFVEEHAYGNSDVTITARDMQGGVSVKTLLDRHTQRKRTN
jgi:hypothetical protein